MFKVSGHFHERKCPYSRGPDPVSVIKECLFTLWRAESNSLSSPPDFC